MKSLLLPLAALGVLALGSRFGRQPKLGKTYDVEIDDGDGGIIVDEVTVEELSDDGRSVYVVSSDVTAGGWMAIKDFWRSVSR